MYTILICDDDRDIVSALDIYLTSEGYQTVKAYNGREALRAAEADSQQVMGAITGGMRAPGLM